MRILTIKMMVFAIICVFSQKIWSAATTPTTQASNVSFNNLNNAFVTIQWTRGNGDTCVVFIKASQSLDQALPGNDVDLTANARFGDGSQITATGWYAVYKGVGTSVTVTGLTPGVNYLVHVIERNGGLTDIKYLTSTASKNPETFVTSNEDKAMYFSDYSDYIIVSPESAQQIGKQDFTLETWVRAFDSASVERVILSNQKTSGDENYYTLSLNKGKPKAVFNISGGSNPDITLTTTANIGDDKWHHVAVVRQGKDLYLYVDGNQVANESSADTLNLSNTQTDAKLTVGAKIVGSVTGYFYGYIDEVRIWTIALEQDSIQLRRYKKLAPGTPGLRLYMPFDNVDSDPFIEKSGNNYSCDLLGINFLQDLIPSGVLKTVYARPAKDITDKRFTAVWDSIPGKIYNILIDDEPGFSYPYVEDNLTSYAHYTVSYDLTPNTQYFYRVITTDGTFYSNTIGVKTKRPLVYDYDGNAYETVVIGEQTWMAQNFRGTHYSDGRPIDFSYYSGDSLSGDYDKWGLFYTQKAALDSNLLPKAQGVCPVGWHVPSKNDWDSLFLNVGGIVNGKKFKSLNGWNAPNTGAADTFGMSIEASGRKYLGSSVDRGTYGIFWTSEVTSGSSFTSGYTVNFFNNTIPTDINNVLITNYEYPVRCIKNFCPKPNVNLGPDTFGILSPSYTLIAPPLQPGDVGDWYNITNETVYGTFSDGYNDTTIFTYESHYDLYRNFRIRWSASNACGKSNSDTIIISFASDQVYLDKLLYAFYPLNGNVNDYSTNGNSGLAYGGSYFTYPDTADKAFVFGYQDSLELSNSSELSMNQYSKRSISLYFNADSIPTNRLAPLISRFGDFKIGLRNSKLWVYGTGADSLSSNATIAVNTWYHLVLQMEGGVNKTKIYLNKTLDKAGTLTYSSFQNEDYTVAGIDYNKPQHYYRGKIDNIGFWERHLNQAEIDSLYQKVSPVKPLPALLSAQFNSSTQKIDLYILEVQYYDDGYYLYRSDNGGTTYTRVDSIGYVMDAGYPIKEDSVQRRKEYYYYLMSFNESGQTKSNVVKISASKPFSGNSLTLNGVDGYLQINDHPKLDFDATDVNYSLEAWFKADTLVPLAGIISKNHNAGSNGYALKFGPTGTNLYFDGVQTPVGSIKEQQWYHVAAVSLNNSKSIYLNGKRMPLTGTPYNVAPNSEFLAIGWDYVNPGDRQFKGEIDEVRIWSVARDSNQIRNNMHKPIDGGFSNLELLLDMDNDQGQSSDTVFDLSSNKLKAYLVNQTPEETFYQSYAIYTPLLQSVGNFTPTSVQIKWSGNSSGKNFVEYNTDSLELLYNSQNHEWMGNSFDYTLDSLKSDSTYFVRLYYYDEEADIYFLGEIFKITMPTCPLPIANAGPDQLNVNATVVSLNGNTVAGASYYWTNLDFGTYGSGSFSNRPIQNPAFDGVPGTTYRLLYEVTNACGTGRDTVTIQFQCNVPGVSNHPQDIAVCPGDSAVFTVTATGYMPKYLWEKGTDSIPGAYTPKYKINAISVGDTGLYRVRVQNICGTYISSYGRLTLKNPPIANAGPDQLNVPGTQVNLAANFPAGTSRMWYNLDSASNGGTFGNRTIENTQFTGQPGKSYRLVWTLSNNCGIGKDTVNISFACEQPFSLAGPDTTITSGATTINLKGIKPLASRQEKGKWYILSGTGATFVSDTTYNTAFTGAIGQTYRLRWNVYNSCGEANDTVQITFTCPLPSITLQPVSINRCSGDSAMFGVTAIGSGISYQWQKDSTNIPGATQPTYKFGNLAGKSGNYRVRVTNTCGTVVSNFASLSLQSVPVANAGPDQLNVIGLQISVAANFPAGVTRMWYNLDSAINGGTFASRNIENTQFSGQPGKTYRLLWVLTNSCGTSRDTLIVSFKKPEPVCKANFTYTVNRTTRQATFINNSSPADNYFWEFGDFQSDTSKNPTHIYNSEGVYQVCLSTYNSLNECFADTCIEIKIQPQDSTLFLFADFNYSVNDKSVQFTNSSSANAKKWYWTFGDGSFSTIQSPSRTYFIPGKYTVCLKVFDSNTGKSAQKCQDIIAGSDPCNVISDFTSLTEGNTVRLTDKSTGKIYNRYWEFGDGSTSTAKNPVRTYDKPGYYLVSLAISDSLGKCFDFSANLIQVGEANCKASFTSNVDGLKVNLTNSSIGSPDKLYWSFDDGASSTLVNPSHTYSEEGIYNINLTVSSNNGLCVDFYEQEVQVGSFDCHASFSYFVDSAKRNVRFINKSTGNNTQAMWSFGDGAISTQRDPVHNYKKAGYYNVSMSTFNAKNACMDYFEETILVGSPANDCEAGYIHQIDNRVVKFTDRSKGDIVKYLWNFGDNSTPSSESSPSHTYTRDGVFNVCLLVENTNGITNITCDKVVIKTANEEPCDADFVFGVDSLTRKVRFRDISLGKPNQWNWDFGNGVKSTNKVDSLVYTTKGYYLVGLTIRNTVTGCQDRTFKLVNVAEAEILKAAFGKDPKGLNLKAGGYPVDFIGTGIGDQAKLRWDFGDETTTDNTSTPTHTYSKPGTYTVCYTVTDPVTSESNQACDTINIPESCGFELATPVAKCTSIVVKLDAQNKATITAKQIDGGSSDNCTDIQLSASKTTFNNTNLGNNTVVLSVTDGSGNTTVCNASVTVEAYTGFTDITRISQFNAYPNPFSQSIRIVYTLVKESNVTIAISSPEGRVIETLFNGKVNNLSNQLDFNTSHLSDGMYLLQISTENGMVVNKLINKQ